VKAVLAQADSMGLDREDGGKGWVLIDDSGPLLIWGVKHTQYSLDISPLISSRSWRARITPDKKFGDHFSSAINILTSYWHS
jgi:hypothetical protein